MIGYHAGVTSISVWGGVVATLADDTRDGHRQTRRQPTESLHRTEAVYRAVPSGQICLSPNGRR
jgi:hypothetical protein